eukprot:3938942-Rhodomonas_salina.6
MLSTVTRTKEASPSHRPPLGSRPPSTGSPCGGVTYSSDANTEACWLVQVTTAVPSDPAVVNNQMVVDRSDAMSTDRI